MKRPGGRVESEEEAELANTLMMLSRSGGEDSADGGGRGASSADTTSTSREFECKTCSRRFPSFQALGGHRASHKKPKLENNGSCSPEKTKAHECSICGLEFAIGQALGGHMRRHRVIAEAFAPPPEKTTVKRCLSFDLNLLPLEKMIDSTNLSLGAR